MGRGPQSVDVDGACPRVPGARIDQGQPSSQRNHQTAHAASPVGPWVLQKIHYVALARVSLNWLSVACLLLSGRRLATTGEFQGARKKPSWPSFRETLERQHAWRCAKWSDKKF
ncbi:predicted protein [Histoplasma capsulatum H143]|uniref:Uncharacterized protein n=1 Tax=Ajellomyces capsulatus (strain H143) TaxID=544712 RepID=C6HCM5_AJECH|nr:predicted protein [Histoplasma capsulatum H143]